MINEDKGEFEKLQQFSEGVVRLGKEIEEKLKEKEALEEELSKKEAEIRTLQMETFELKGKLIKINLELSKLEKRRKEFEGGE